MGSCKFDWRGHCFGTMWIKVPRKGYTFYVETTSGRTFLSRLLFTVYRGNCCKTVQKYFERAFGGFINPHLNCDNVSNFTISICCTSISKAFAWIMCSNFCLFIIIRSCPSVKIQVLSHPRAKNGLIDSYLGKGAYYRHPMNRLFGSCSVYFPAVSYPSRTITYISLIIVDIRAWIGNLAHKNMGCNHFMSKFSGDSANHH